MPHIVATIDGESYQYPAMYGSGTCEAWDMGLEPSCAMNEEDYCEQSWCYVDADCMASDVTESGIFEGLQYSYNTCGSTSMDEDAEDALTRFEEFIQGIKDAAAADDEEDEATMEEGAEVEETVTEEEVEETVTEEPVAEDDEDEEQTVEEDAEETVVEDDATEEPAQDDEQIDETGICECLETHG